MNRLRAGGTALGLCVALSMGCSPERRVERHRERAEELRARGDVAGAALEIRSALEIEPQNVDLALRLAELVAAVGDPEQALFLREQAHRLAPERSDAAIALAGSLAARDPARADTIVDAVVAREPERADAYGLRGEIAMVRGDLPAALAAAERAVALAPDDARARLVRGRVRFAALALRGRGGDRVGDDTFAEAIADLDAAIAGGDAATAGLARAVRARLYAVWPGHGAEAERAFRERIEIAFASGSPAERTEAASAAERYATRTRNAELLRFALDKRVQADPGSEAAWRAFTLAEEQAGRSPDPVFERMRAARPGDPVAARLHAQLLVERGRSADAIAVLERAAEERPDAPEILEMLAHALFDLGRSQEGTRVLERLEAEHPGAPATRLAHAREAVRGGELERAVGILVDLTTTADGVEAQLLLAGAYLQLGRPESATDAVERAKELGGAGSPRLLRIELRIDQAAGRWREVVQDFRALEAGGFSPSAPELVAVAEALHEIGRTGDARRLLDRVLTLAEPPPQAALEFARRYGASEPARAAQLLEAALTRAPRDLRLLVALAKSDADRGDVTGALARLDAAGKPPPIPVALERARLLALAKRDREAETDLLALLERAPELREATDLLVALHRRQGSLDGAIATLEQRAAQGELPAASRVLLARLALGAGRRDLARASLEAALAARPELAGARSDLALLLAEDGQDLDRARTLAEEARSAQPADAAAARALGVVLLRSGEPGAALAELDAARALARGRSDAALEVQRGLALEALGRTAEAKDAYEGALRTEPGRHDARDGLARIGGS